MAGDGIDFINFIIDALDDKPLMKEALKIEKPKKLFEFFQKNGYVDVVFKDCAALVKASKAARGKGVTEQGDPVDVEEAERPPGY